MIESDFTKEEKEITYITINEILKESYGDEIFTECRLKDSDTNKSVNFKDFISNSRIKLNEKIFRTYFDTIDLGERRLYSYSREYIMERLDETFTKLLIELIENNLYNSNTYLLTLYNELWDKELKYKLDDVVFINYKKIQEKISDLTIDDKNYESFIIKLTEDSRLLYYMLSNFHLCKTTCVINEKRLKELDKNIAEAIDASKDKIKILVNFVSEFYKHTLKDAKTIYSGAKKKDLIKVFKIYNLRNEYDNVEYKRYKEDYSSFKKLLKNNIKDIKKEYKRLNKNNDEELNYKEILDMIILEGYIIIPSMQPVKTDEVIENTKQ